VGGHLSDLLEKPMDPAVSPPPAGCNCFGGRGGGFCKPTLCPGRAACRVLPSACPTPRRGLNWCSGLRRPHRHSSSSRFAAGLLPRSPAILRSRIVRVRSANYHKVLLFRTPASRGLAAGFLSNTLARKKMKFFSWSGRKQQP
jgi:hypothetical protein